jgi:hypothetical protein
MRLLAVAVVAFTALLYADVAGKFAGTWTSGANSNSGDLRMSFTGSGSGDYAAQSSFTYQGQEIKTAPVSVKITGDQVEVVFSFDIEGAKLHSTMRGTLTGDKIKGKYVSQDDGGQPVDEGVWEATRK